MAGKHGIHAAFINDHIVLLFALVKEDWGSGRWGHGIGDHPSTVPSWNVPILGWEAEKREGGLYSRGAESCVRRERPGWDRKMKPHCTECLLAPAMNPLLDLAHIPLYEIRPCRAERLSPVVRNNLTVCHRGAPLPTRAEVCSRECCCVRLREFLWVWFKKVQEFAWMNVSEGLLHHIMPDFIHVDE